MWRDYVANGGWETFLAYEDAEQDILVGLLRLRKCARTTFRPELLPQQSASALCAAPNEDLDDAKARDQKICNTDGKVCSALDFCGCSIVRELHVYGSEVPVSARDPTKFQHQASYRVCTYSST